MQLVTTDTFLKSRDGTATLFVQNIRRSDISAFGEERTLIFVHGGTNAASATFALEIEGISWANYHATRGWDVWYLDARGFGRSTRPPEMLLPQHEAPPINRTATAQEDLDVVVEHIFAARRISKISFISFSWGTLITGGWCARRPDAVHRIVMFGASWGVSPQAKLATAYGYMTWTLEEGLQRMQSGIPSDRRDEIFPPAWRKLWSEALLDSDPRAREFDPPRMHTPTGVLTDFKEQTAMGRPIYDPAEIKAPILLIRGAWDEATNRSSVLELFDRLVNAEKRQYVEIANGTHFMHIEKHRLSLFSTVHNFLSGDL